MPQLHAIPQHQVANTLGDFLNQNLQCADWFQVLLQACQQMVEVPLALAIK